MTIVHQRRIGSALFVAGLLGAMAVVHSPSGRAGGFELSDVRLDSITAGAARQTVNARASAKGARPIAATLTSSNTVTSGTGRPEGRVSGALGIGVAYGCCEQSRAEVEITTNLSGSKGFGFNRSRKSRSASGMSFEISVQAGLRFTP